MSANSESAASWYPDAELTEPYGDLLTQRRLLRHIVRLIRASPRRANNS